MPAEIIEAERDEWKRRAIKAELSLRHYGYTDRGGELWMPQLGKPPKFDLMDRYKEQAESTERMAGLYAEAAYKTWLQLLEARKTIAAKDAVIEMYERRDELGREQQNRVD